MLILGDHGQAFGQHGRWGHGNSVYEEGLRIPLLLVESRLFHGEVDSTVGGIIDLAPTITDVLGLQMAPTWQGRSLFETNRPGRVYFMDPFTSFRFGLREGTNKLVFDGTSNTAEHFDLASDPNELRPASPAVPDSVDAGLDRLASWVQFQQWYWRDYLVPAAR